MAVRIMNAQPVLNWPVRLRNALALDGYATLDLRAQPGPQMISPAHLLQVVERGYQGLPLGWQAVINHLQALKPLDVDTVAIKAQRRNILMVIGRGSSTSLSLEGVGEYFAGIEIWLETFSELLPRLKANDEEKKAVTAVAGAVGSAWGPVAAQAATTLLTAFVEASGGGSAVTIHPVLDSPAFASSFSARDFTSLSTGSLGNRNWLWETGAGRITESAEPNDFGVSPPLSAAELARMLTATAG